MESKKALEAAQSEAQDSTETEDIEQPSTVEKTECVEDKNDKAPGRGM